MQTIRFTAVLFLVLSACSASAPPKVEKPFAVATTKTASQGVYYPGRFVRAPHPKIKTPVKVSKEKIVPVILYDLPDSTLCEISSALAASLRYSNFCESSLNDRKLNVNLLGTPFELAEYIMKEADIYISIDVNNREVRFLTKQAVTPEL